MRILLSMLILLLPTKLKALGLQRCKMYGARVNKVHEGLPARIVDTIIYTLITQFSADS